MLALKSVKQSYSPSKDILCLLQEFRQITNAAIEIGLAHEVSTLKRLCNLAYNQLKRYRVPSCYKLCAISRAAGILASRKKSLRRGIQTKEPYALKPHLTCCYRFKITKGGSLRIPLGDKRFEEIPLNNHTLLTLSDPSLRIRSFTLTEKSVSLCISKDVDQKDCVCVVGVDRNLRNLTCGNEYEVVHYNMSKAVRIAKKTRAIVSSFKRCDVRIRRKIASKYGRRRRDRINHLLHCASKQIVERASQNGEALVLEDIRGIRKLYRKGNGQGRQIQYKAAWKGLPVIHLTRSETRGTSTQCPKCGERLQSDKNLRRKLWCGKCRRLMDRDVVAAINLSRRGRLRFDRSLPDVAKGGAAEAVKGNPTPTVILRVDASKLTCHPNKLAEPISSFREREESRGLPKCR